MFLDKLDEGTLMMFKEQIQGYRPVRINGTFLHYVGRRRYPTFVLTGGCCYYIITTTPAREFLGGCKYWSNVQILDALLDVCTFCRSSTD